MEPAAQSPKSCSQKERQAPLPRLPGRVLATSYSPPRHAEARSGGRWHHLRCPPCRVPTVTGPVPEAGEACMSLSCPGPCPWPLEVWLGQGRGCSPGASWALQGAGRCPGVQSASEALGPAALVLLTGSAAVLAPWESCGRTSCWEGAALMTPPRQLLCGQPCPPRPIPPHPDAKGPPGYAAAALP